MSSTEHDIERSELRWAAVALAFLGIIFALTLFAALALQRNPPSNLERIDPKNLHLTGEFTEPNLGTRVEAEFRSGRSVLTAVGGGPVLPIIFKLGLPVTPGGELVAICLRQPKSEAHHLAP